VRILGLMRRPLDLPDTASGDHHRIVGSEEHSPTHDVLRLIELVQRRGRNHPFEGLAMLAQRKGLNVDLRREPKGIPS